jgi:hypothetical protein
VPTSVDSHLLQIVAAGMAIGGLTHLLHGRQPSDANSNDANDHH